MNFVLFQGGKKQPGGEVESLLQLNKLFLISSMMYLMDFLFGLFYFLEARTDFDESFSEILNGLSSMDFGFPA